MSPDTPSIAAVIGWPGTPCETSVLDTLARCGDVLGVAVVGDSPAGQHKVIPTENLWSISAVRDTLWWFESTGATHLLWIMSPLPDLPDAGLKRLISCARDTGAAIVYSDYADGAPDGTAELHPLIEYQPGSLRDDFDFGQIVLLRGAELAGICTEIEEDSVASKFGGWYDLRLRLSEHGPIVHLPEPTYSVPAVEAGETASGEAHFSYVDPRNRDYQIEMERIATAHLKRVGAYLEPPDAPVAKEVGSYCAEASVVIPVRNRGRTIGDAVGSALSQEAAFDFNVLVVDNHSNDGTTEILAAMAAGDTRLVHITPNRTDLGIGGCWNEAIYSPACGRYAVQLDSDDLYAMPDVLANIVDEFRRSGCAMVIGSYTIVDFDLNPIPPGLIDHREWTAENGHNNALRIAGLGAPRAFHTATLRTIGFPNVSYGEDYAVALQMTRRYRIGRIYHSLYWCRRWEENTDHALPLASINRYASYKDRLRTIELAARQAAARDK